MSDDVQRMEAEGDEWTVRKDGSYVSIECELIGGGDVDMVIIPPDVLPWLRDQIDRHLEGGD